MLLGAVRPDRWDGWPVEAEQPVGVVLKHEQPCRTADLEDLGTSGGRQRGPGRVVEVGDRVEELGASTRGRHRRDRLAQRLGDEPGGIHGHVHDVSLVGREGAERPDVRRGLGDHDVTGVAEDPRHEVQRLLAADRDHNVVRGADDALERHHLADHLAQRRVALPGAVLQRLRAPGREQVRQQFADSVEREGCRVGHPTGQRDDLGSAGDGEQGANFRGGHPGGARGVATGEGVQRHP